MYSWTSLAQHTVCYSEPMIYIINEHLTFTCPRVSGNKPLGIVGIDNILNQE